MSIAVNYRSGQDFSPECLPYARAIVRSQRPWGGKAPLSVADYDDFVLWVTLGIILGGRIGYVLFYNPGYFAGHPLESLQLC